MTGGLQERFARKNEAVELRKAFDALDSKRDGKLDAHELGQLFHRLGHSLRKVGFTTVKGALLVAAQ